MTLADLRRWEMQALDKLLGRLLNEASLAHGRGAKAEAGVWEAEARAVNDLRDRVARRRR